MIIKKLLSRKKDMNEIVQHEVSKALRVQEIKYLQETEIQRLAHLKIQTEAQQNMVDEIEKMKVGIGKGYKIKIKRIRENYDKIIKRQKAEKNELEDKVKFAQDFWRKQVGNANEIQNIAIVLESKAEILLRNENEEYHLRVRQRTEELQTVRVECEKLDKINLRMKKADSDGTKLLNILEKED